MQQNKSKATLKIIEDGGQPNLAKKLSQNPSKPKKQQKTSKKPKKPAKNPIKKREASSYSNTYKQRKAQNISNLPSNALKKPSQPRRFMN